MKRLRKALISSFIGLFSMQSVACEFANIDPMFCEEIERMSNDYNDMKGHLSYYDPMSFDLSFNSHRHPLDPLYNWNPTYSRVGIPVDLNAAELATAIGLTASAIIFFNNDQEIMDFVQENRNDVTEVVAWAGEKVGRAELFGLGGYVLGVVLKNGKIKKTSLMITKATFAAGLITRVLKMSFGRERPNRDSGPYEFHGPTLDHHSFPSGHTTSAFAFATVIAETYKDRSKLIPVLAYGAAAIGAWSRVHDKAHWASDVAIGALIGHFTAKFLMRMGRGDDEDSDRRSNARAFIMPVLAPDYIGLHVMLNLDRRPLEPEIEYLSDMDCEDQRSPSYCF